MLLAYVGLMFMYSVLLIFKALEVNLLCKMQSNKMDRFLKDNHAVKETDSGSEQTLSTSEKAKQQPTRKYNESYLSYGFTGTGSGDYPFPLCLACGYKMANESLLPRKLRKHLKTVHSHFQDKPVSYFKRLSKQQTRASNSFKSVSNLFCLLAKKVVTTMLGNETAMKISEIPLSNDTVHRPIIEMCIDIEKNACNITNQSQLLAFVRFINQDQIVNHYRFCKELSGSAKGVDVFNILHCYLNCFRGLISVEDVIVTLCFLHREALIAKALGKKFREVLEQVVQMVNFIQTRPVKTCLFEKLCIDMQSEHRRLLLHKEVSDCRGRKYLTVCMSYDKEFSHCMQGKQENILTSTNKIKMFHGKLQIWKRKVVQCNLEMFQLVRSMCINKILAIVVDYLISLEETLSSFFPSFNTERLDLKPIHGNFP
ncbi:zinc finger BED domain-containing protein 5-like [Schistocerca americana]|uniref:zinc finger BED domain-containing protein 5-like n=1 Tax=Schistocerca americana TaxID=7009 RepID=UPI001F4FADAE|nr:zinc finger BED domain-containing protein 5-like [Schistocerca americana]